MTEFTFITLAYNQEAYIVEHLESIKNIVLNYGKDISVDYLLADDGSADNTVGVCKEWLKTNGSCFREVKVLNPKNNSGLVANLLSAIKSCKTKQFKFLAADDKYYDNNLFEIYNNISNKMVVTPIIPFKADMIPADYRELVNRFFMLFYAYEKNQVRALQQIQNYIPAPGVFVDCDLLKSIEFCDYMSQFKNIEDYPMWHYLLDKGCKLEVCVKPYICYRLNSGISMNKKHSKRKAYIDERIVVNKKLNAKFDKYPKYINPYRYILKMFELNMKKMRNYLTEKITDDSLRDIYR